MTANSPNKLEQHRLLILRAYFEVSAQATKQLDELLLLHVNALGGAPEALLGPTIPDQSTDIEEFQALWDGWAGRLRRAAERVQDWELIELAKQWRIDPPEAAIVASREYLRLRAAQWGATPAESTLLGKPVLPAKKQTARPYRMAALRLMGMSDQQIADLEKESDPRSIARAIERTFKEAEMTPPLRKRGRPPKTQS